MTRYMGLDNGERALLRGVTLRAIATGGDPSGYLHRLVDKIDNLDDPRTIDTRGNQAPLDSHQGGKE